MKKYHKGNLAGLRSAIDLLGGWACIGHVEYLMDRLAELKVRADWSDAMTTSHLNLIERDRDPRPSNATG